MPWYRFEGDNHAAAKAARLVTEDLEDVKRNVKLGQYIELTPEQYADMPARLKFTAALPPDSSYIAPELEPEDPDGSGDQDGIGQIPGPKGDKGDPGEGFNIRGAWSVVALYAEGDVVTWQGSTYVAMSDIAAGGTNPRVNTANWLCMAQGGGEIAYAENTQAFPIGSLALNTSIDIPGCVIVVPAGSGPHLIRGGGVGQLTTSAAGAASAGAFRLFLVDVASGFAISQDMAKVPLLASQSFIKRMHVEARQPATAVDKSYKLRCFVDNVANTSAAMFANSGNAAPPTATAAGPVFIEAVAL